MRGIEFEVVWFDQDVIQCQVTCSNGPFRGATKIYLAHDDLSKAAETLGGFPSNIKDSRDVQLGAIESKMAGGGISMSFRCVDSVGHAVVIVDPMSLNLSVCIFRSKRVQSIPHPPVP